MWRGRSNRGEQSVVCIACGDSLSRRNAREYDKEGNRWERDGKEFEYLCKPCHRELCHQPRGDLESLLVDVERDRDGRTGPAQFLRAYQGAVRERYGAAGPGASGSGAEGDRDARGE
ncbi:DUF7562 family protein [Halorarum salinum]|uniref:Small CPxCG-related zinc finger protein n=1 Tax=Halorarum salinum TaxID=2743089 RepID=A0A7D5QIZ7_9EURY|nr:hypothetical protein [Halobaculum salinum]QLG63742.1 hypothetical protein HUG12_19240 [Halobaculum salinum]